MGYQVTEYQDTPNPNAVKCVLDRPAKALEREGMRSYQAAAQAGADPLAAALMAIPGVAGVLVHGAWVTVSKTPDAAWKVVRASIKKVLSEAE